MSGISIDKNRRVLVIDDNPSIHKDFRKILMPSNHLTELAVAAAEFFGDSSDLNDDSLVQLEFASNGKQGANLCTGALAAGRPFALAFVDMRMPPGWDGLRTATELWKIDPNLQIVICSAYSDHSWTDIRERLGNSDRMLIMKKPFDNVEVLQITTALIEKRYLTDKSDLRTEELEEAVKERTRHLNEARQEAQVLISSIGSVLIWLNVEGEVKHWNRRSEELFGIFSDVAIGRRFDQLPIDWEDISAVNQLMSTESNRVDAEFFDSSGNRRNVGMSSYDVSDKRFQHGTLILGTELTEQRLLESQLLQAQKLEAVGQLAAGVAHEINTPMQYLGDNLDYVGKRVALLEPLIDALGDLESESESGQASPETIRRVIEASRKLKGRKFIDGVTEAIDDSLGGVRHVSKIVRAMKEFAHPGQEEKIQVDINRALESTIAVSTNEWKYVAELETHFDETNPQVTALAVELNQVFLNILVNAAHAVGDATDEGKLGRGKISVTTEMVENHVRVSIADTGTGIPEHVQARIFDPFFTTKEVGKGTGQGLAIAHSVVVQKHNGRLWCESSSGEGTTFFIDIPVEPKRLTESGCEKDNEVMIGV